MIKKLLVKCLLLMTLVLASFCRTASASENTDNFIISESGVLEKYNGNEKTVIVPENVTAIGREAFSGNKNIEKIIIPEGVTTINKDAFNNCTNLCEIVFPSTLENLYCRDFVGCENLKEITLPKRITDGSWSYFGINSAIEKVHVVEDNEVYSSIDGVLFSKDKTQLIHYPPNRKDSTYAIPDSVTDLFYSNFSNAKYLKKIVLGKNVSGGIRGSSFSNGVLEYIEVPAENKAFCDIDGVLFTKDKKELVAYPEKKPDKIYMVPEGTKRIRDWSICREFSSTMELRYILIPNSVEKIENCVGFFYEEYGFGPNDELTLCGNSIVKKYAEENRMKYCKYDSSSKKLQILINASSLDLSIGDKYNLDLILLPQNTKEKVTWKSSNKSIATVNKNGVITACGIGKATITGSTESGAKVSCDVFVRLQTPPNIKINRVSSTSNDIKIEWDKVDGAKGYIIYLADYFFGHEKIGSTSANSFIYKNPEPDRYYTFKIEAYHKEEKYNSPLSKDIFILIPSTPTNINLNLNNEGVYITWKGTDRPYTNGYAIYRSESKNDDYIKIGETKGNDDWSFTDKNVSKNKTYYYKIRAYEEVDGKNVYSNYSVPEAIKVK